MTVAGGAEPRACFSPEACVTAASGRPNGATGGPCYAGRMSASDEEPTAAPQQPQRTPPRERFEGDEHLFDVAVERQRLRDEPGGARDGHRQVTLFRGGGVSIVLFDFEAGGQLKDHAANGYVTVLVLSGEIRMATAEEQHQMSSGSLLVLRPGISHDLEASVASSVLLTVRLDPSEDDRP